MVANHIAIDLKNALEGRPRVCPEVYSALICRGRRTEKKFWSLGNFEIT